MFLDVSKRLRKLQVRMPPVGSYTVTIGAAVIQHSEPWKQQTTLALSLCSQGIIYLETPSEIRMRLPNTITLSTSALEKDGE